MGRCGGTAALLTGLGGEVGWALRPKQPFEGGTNVYPKPTPKQDKGGGINPPPMALACGLEDGAAGRQIAAPPRSVFRLSLACNTRETRGFLGEYIRTPMYSVLLKKQSVHLEYLMIPLKLKFFYHYMRSHMLFSSSHTLWL